MIGIVVVTHSNLGDAFIEAAEFILGERSESLISVSININENADKLREMVDRGIKEVDQNEGVLILTDMFGGTPSNLSYSFLEEGHVEVISGINLPVLIKAVSMRKSMELSQLAEKVADYGRKSISLASGILKGNKTDR